ncbi:MAG: NAD(P)/FAD-dependent oxidoreductase [Ruminococcaceae bacterium]|nr:NAD(P)/FAD-dependent oxidoreductase [Oscillospiraceae bacterium]
MFDFVVIGAGVVGGMVARELTKYTDSVCIVERGSDVALGATRANSAIVHAGYDAKSGSLKAKLNVRGSVMMESVCRELGVKYKRNGSLVVGFNDEDRANLTELVERGKTNGVEGVALIEREDILKLEPNIGAGVTVALHAPTGAIVCPYELCMSAVGSAMDNGADLKLNFRVDKIEKIDDGYRVYAGENFVDAKFVINCAGVYSDEIAALVGDDSFSVRARRGEYVLLDRECGSHVSHTIFRCPSKMGKGVLVTPTVDGNLLVGPSAEDIDDKEDLSTTAAGLAKVRALAAEQVAGIDFSKTITSFTGLRATGSTGDFIINMPKERFLNLAGIESPGLSSAPAIAEYAIQILKDAGFDASLRADFVAERRPAHFFSSLSVEEKNALIKERPEYAHVICRCETITEGEILDAIRTNPRPTDVDGVKRRTRASMGRCQGGFCSPYIVELLAKEMGVDYTAVTKFGGKSYINFGKTKGE